MQVTYIPLLIQENPDNFTNNDRAEFYHIYCTSVPLLIV